MEIQKDAAKTPPEPNRLEHLNARPRPPLDPRKRRLPDGRIVPSELEVVRMLHEKGVPALTLSEFVAAAWEHVDPKPLVWNWHLDFICFHLEAVLRGPTGVIPGLCPYTGKPWKWVQNLLMNVPPGTSKSLVVSVFAPAWMWLWKPAWRAIFSSANDTVSNRDSVKCRMLIESDWYQKTFAPKWKLSDDQNAKTLFANTSRGYRRATTTERKVTGERADALFIDDPHDANDLTKTSITNVRNWYTDAYANRVSQPETSVRVCIMQRLHEEDLSELLLSLGFAHVCLPMEYEPEGPGAVETFLGCRDPRTQEAEILFPWLYPPVVLYGEGGTKDAPTGGEVKRLRGSYAGQMQQRPVAAAGNKFQREWWRFWCRDGKQHERPKGSTMAPPKVLLLTADFDEVIVSVDCAFKDNPENDYVVILVLGRIGADKFVLDVRREHLSFTATKKALLKTRSDWPNAYKIIVEDKANGTAVIDDLKSLISGIVGFTPGPGDSKEARAVVAEAQCESGNIYLPEGAPWLQAWVDEFASFPKGRNDDQVDALSQALIDMADEELHTTRLLLGM
jgi:predicted phage terminase large subunit-like protein